MEKVSAKKYYDLFNDYALTHNLYHNLIKLNSFDTISEFRSESGEVLFKRCCRIWRNNISRKNYTIDYYVKAM